MPLYLNHAGTSWPKPPEVHAAIVGAGEAPPGAWAARFAEAHAAVAAAFGTTPDHLLPTPGCTPALAAAVGSLPWVAGDRVLTSGREHDALAGPLAALQARGVEVVEIPPGDGPVDLEAAERALRTGGVRLVAFSLASNVSGEILPYRALIALAQAHGARTLLDGAQAAGWLPLDLPSLGVDFFAFAGHKGPQAPHGIGGLYRRPGAGLGYCEVGSVNLSGLCALAAGLRWMAAEAPLARTRAVEARFRARVQELPGVRVVGAGLRMPTCSVVVAGRAPGEVAEALAARQVWVRAGLHCASRAHRTLGTAPQGTVRFSFGPSARDRDADEAIHALREVLAGPPPA